MIRAWPSPTLRRRPLNSQTQVSHAGFDQRLFGLVLVTAGYGGSQTIDGNATLGSNNASSSIYGTAVGADYRFSLFTLAGFALAGGGTNFSVNGLGSGRSDLFQAGAFIRRAVDLARPRCLGP